MRENISAIVILLFSFSLIQAQQNKVISILEILNIATGERITIREYPVKK